MRKYAFLSVLIASFFLFNPLSFAGISVCNTDPISFSLRGSAVEGCLYYDSGQNVTVEKYDQIKNLLQSIEQKYLKILNGFPVEMSSQEKVDVDNALAALLELNYRTDQKNNYNGSQGVYLRALIDILIKELNDTRKWTRDFKTEVAAATNLADLKARVANLPTLNDRTLAQAKNQSPLIKASKREGALVSAGAPNCSS